MKVIKSQDITDKVKEMCIQACTVLGQDVIESINKNKERESNPRAKHILEILEQNAIIAKEKNIPLCQDTGMAVFFVQLGQEVIIEGEDLETAINKGVSKAYVDGFLRKSVVSPIDRSNTKDNTPAIIYIEMVKGDKLSIKFAAKGFGSENMSQVKMLKPSDGLEGIKDFIIQVVKDAGPNPCPPIVVGVGIGGTFDKAAVLAKKSLFRDIGQHSQDPFIRDLEIELLDKINCLDIGPQGFGGDTTGLAVNIETYPTHIAGLPVAVNINCHSSRHREIVF